MSRYLIVSEEGSDSVWVIDTLKKSVEEMDASDLRGDATIKGIAVAVAANTRLAAASHNFYNG